MLHTIWTKRTKSNNKKGTLPKALKFFMTWIHVASVQIKSAVWRVELDFVVVWLLFLASGVKYRLNL